MSTVHKHAIPARKQVALIAHDACKASFLEWAHYNRLTLAQHDLFGTATTGSLVARELGLDVTCFESGPDGGDQQIGAAITEGLINVVFFFWDASKIQGHATDVQALIRLAVLRDVPVACSRASADFLVSSPLMSGHYRNTVPGARPPAATVAQARRRTAGARVAVTG